MVIQMHANKKVYEVLSFMNFSYLFINVSRMFIFSIRSTGIYRKGSENSRNESHLCRHTSGLSDLQQVN